jgi:hypothetical protein
MHIHAAAAHRTARREGDWAAQWTQPAAPVPARWRGARARCLQHAALVLVVVCVLPATPRTGADAHRAMSSPDLATIARSWCSELPHGHRESLTETPAMRLTKHLDALKAMARSRREHAGAHAAQHSDAAAVPRECYPEQPAGAQVGAAGPRRKLFDDAHFSTVTPEPSDTMFQAPLEPEQAEAFRSCWCSPQYGSLEHHTLLLAQGQQPRAAAQDLDTQYMHIKRRIALGRPSAKTCGRHSVVCFDFDRTLSQDHVHRMTEASRTGLTPQEAVAAFGGGRRIQQLSAFLTELEASGAAIHIVSFGHKDDIMASLASVGLDKLFPAQRIIGCDEIRHLRLVTKAQCTAYVAEHYGLRCQDVLLVDDDHEQLLECSEMEGMALGGARGGGGLQGGAESEDRDRGRCGTYWVSSGKGLTACDMAAISGMTRFRHMALSSS